MIWMIWSFADNLSNARDNMVWNGENNTQVTEVKAEGETNLIFYAWFLMMRNSHLERAQHHHVVNLIQVSPRIDPHSGVTPYQASS